MIKRSAIFSSCALLGGAALLPNVARAQVPSLFATFSQANSNPAFQLQSGSGSASLGLNNPLPVNFQFQTANGFSPGVGDNIPASMTMSSTASGAAFLDAGVWVQPLSGIDMRFTSLSAAPNSGDLLHVFLTTGSLVGQPGGRTAFLAGTESATDTSVVNFSSNYLDFTGPLTNKNFAVSFTSVNPPIALGGDGHIAPFAATGTGNFGTAPKVPSRNIPEPGTLALVGLGLAGLLARTRRLESVGA